MRIIQIICKSFILVFLKNKDVYFKNLVGLRAVAALAVVFHHIVIWIPGVEDNSGLHLFKKLISFSNYGGTLGVIFFFILSGFLIYFLLIQEEFNKKKIDLAKFYSRRALRIWPLYYLTIIIGFIVYPLLNNGVVVNVSGINYSFF